MAEPTLQHTTTGGAYSMPDEPPLLPDEIKFLVTQRRGYLMLVAAINERLGQQYCPSCGKRKDK